MNVRGVQFLQDVFNVVRRDDILWEFAIQIVVRQEFLVAAELQQPVHHIVSIFFFNSHDCSFLLFVRSDLVGRFAVRQESAALF